MQCFMFKITDTSVKNYSLQFSYLTMHYFQLQMSVSNLCQEYVERAMSNKFSVFWNLPSVARVGGGEAGDVYVWIYGSSASRAQWDKKQSARAPQQELPQSAMSSPGRGPGQPALGGVPAVSSARDISDTRTARTYVVFLKGKTLSNGLT